MNSIDFDDIGDYHKALEQREAGRAIMPGLPVLARLDGRGFHNFTKGLKRPFDEDMSYAMQAVTKHLVESFCPNIGYTQSDEITLCWINPEVDETHILFGGKYQKLCSILAANASVVFNQLVLASLGIEYAARMPQFDCRVWQVPNRDIAAQNILWREMDASKNAVSMAASAYYSHKQLHGKSTRERLQMLEERAVQFFQDYPEYFQRGSYFARRQVTRELTDAELAPIPIAFRPSGPVERMRVEEVKLPKALSVSNWTEVLFEGAEPLKHVIMPTIKDSSNETNP